MPALSYMGSRGAYRFDARVDSEEYRPMPSTFSMTAWRCAVQSRRRRHRSVPFAVVVIHGRVPPGENLAFRPTHEAATVHHATGSACFRLRTTLQEGVRSGIRGVFHALSGAHGERLVKISRYSSIGNAARRVRRRCSRTAVCRGDHREPGKSAARDRGVRGRAGRHHGRLRREPGRSQRRLRHGGGPGGLEYLPGRPGSASVSGRDGQGAARLRDERRVCAGEPGRDAAPVRFAADRHDGGSTTCSAARGWSSSRCAGRAGT